MTNLEPTLFNILTQRPDCPQMDRIYRHIKNGTKYVTRDFIRLKIAGEWVDGIVYEKLVDDGLNELFSRILEDFNENFELIDDG